MSELLTLETAQQTLSFLVTLHRAHVQKFVLTITPRISLTLARSNTSRRGQPQLLGSNLFVVRASCLSSCLEWGTCCSSGQCAFLSQPSTYCENCLRFSCGGSMRCNCMSGNCVYWQLCLANSDLVQAAPAAGLSGAQVPAPAGTGSGRRGPARGGGRGCRAGRVRPRRCGAGSGATARLAAMSRQGTRPCNHHTNL